MKVAYEHVRFEDFAIDIPEWTEILTGRTWNPTSREPGTRVMMLAGQTENGPIWALFQEEQHGMYYYYRNLCGNAPDIDTRKLVLYKVIDKLEAGYRFIVEVSTRPEYNRHMLEGQHGKIIGLSDVTRIPKKPLYEATVSFPLSLVEGSNEPGNSVDIVRRVYLEDLKLRHVLPPVKTTVVQEIKSTDSSIN